MNHAKIHWLIDLIQLPYVDILYNSAEKNPEVFPGNKTSGIYCRKSLISHSNKKTKTKTKTKTYDHKKCVQRSKQETEKFVSNCKQKKPL